VQPYTSDYYGTYRDGARRSAQVLVPLVLQLVRARSVIDVGCGQGTWLAVFREHGVQEILGVDGDYVDPTRLEIAPECFRARDLKQPLRLDRRFDLVVSLEVAEHLPEGCAALFVESLSCLGPLVLFSAAAPHQGGEQHLNEQWPNYWAQRFRVCGFEPVDCLRRRVWEDDRVQWWYAQNIFLYAELEFLKRQPYLRLEHAFTGGAALPLAHPKKYLDWVEWGLNQYELASAAANDAAANEKGETSDGQD
jgi:SAM-dependent methyltransferase